MDVRVGLLLTRWLFLPVFFSVSLSDECYVIFAEMLHGGSDWVGSCPSLHFAWAVVMSLSKEVIISDRISQFI